MPSVRVRQVQVRVTVEEYGRVRRAADLADLSVSAWVRRMLLATLAPVATPPVQELPPVPPGTDIQAAISAGIDAYDQRDTTQPHRHHREVASTEMVFGREVKMYRCRDCGETLI